MTATATPPTIPRCPPLARLPHILLVEDDPGDRVLFEQALAEVGVVAVLQLAEDVPQALRFFPEPGGGVDGAGTRMPDLVVLDLALPGIRGDGFLDLLRARQPQRPVPVIVFTSSVDSALRDRCLSLGATCCRTKPMRWDEYQAFARFVLECLER